MSHMEKEDFPALAPDVEHIKEVESMCVNCGENGITRMLLTKIPFFREVVVMAFECPECNYRNSEVQAGGRIQDKGVRFEFTLTGKEDLNREVVKSDTAVMSIPELDFEVPSATQKGVMSTIEGLLSQAYEGINKLQVARRLADPDTAAKIDAFLARLQSVLDGELQCTVVLDDPAGNSFLQNPHAPATDPFLTVSHYTRTVVQAESLGLNLEQEVAMGAVRDPQTYHDAVARAQGGQPELNPAIKSASLGQYVEQAQVDKNFVEKEVMVLPAQCPSCHQEGDQKMFVTEIPHFKEIVLMAFKCDACGFKSTEVKAGGGIAPHGRRTTLRITDREDLNRDLLKSETASLQVPEIGLSLETGTLGGMFTTVEGLLTKVHEQLSKSNPFVAGDSADAESHRRYVEFLGKLHGLHAVDTPWTLVLDDPVANSYLQNVYAPDPDPEMTVEEYERTAEQNDELGISHMNV